ncbi:CoA-binding protein [Desulfonema ishimotonii]|uniref:CoA-binding protein n=1 Tax=Desulfonema ishimotonii TaxID=45657 RepID=A0A401FQ67_9BACT|nr:GNAT family N-acetyltransferase [Desulfonema ishimotonii]GBC59133.1 CoA-binding protein [Desulfonema ishimotonii]
MSITDLDRMFHPESVAVIGANEREGSIGAALIKNLIAGGYTGKIYPVNPRYQTICNLPAFPSVSAPEVPADLAVVATPIDTAPRIIRECGTAGVGGVALISTGGRETGEKGRAPVADIRAAAHASGIRVIGPDCTGIVCNRAKLNASFASRMPLPGKTAFISQSGSIYSAILDLSIREKVGFSYFVSLGSMADVDFGDAIDYLGGDARVGSIVIYMEALNRFRNFMSAARSVARVKPIVVMKAGRTQAGAVAASAHSGAVPGEDAVYDAAFRRAGIIRVKTFEELFDCAELLAKRPRPTRTGLAIITNAGGPGVMAVDALSDYGVEPVTFSPETIRRLDAVLPPCRSRTNPADLLANASPERYGQVVRICLDAPEVDGVLVILTPNAISQATEVARHLTQTLDGRPHPLFTSWMGGPEVEPGRAIFNQAGIPTFDTPERAVRAFMDLYRYTRRIEMIQEIPPALPRLRFDPAAARVVVRAGLERQNGLLTAAEARTLLTAYGIPVSRTIATTTEDEALKATCDIGFPASLKRLCPDPESDLSGAFRRVTVNGLPQTPPEKPNGVAVGPMFREPAYELALAARRDPNFGPIILFGMGGIPGEVVDDRAIALPPLNRLLARRLMEGTRVWRLLQGDRHTPPANLEKLEEILIRLSQLVTDFAEIEGLSLNPLRITADGFCATDVRVTVRPARVPSPMHLVISPYPNRHEAHIVTRDGEKLFIRPIRPEDAPLMVRMFEKLSPRSVYYRFFAPIRSLRHEMLARFTQIDYDRETALVAIREEAGEEMLGVGRVITERNGKNGEFAVLIADACQGMGIGAELLSRCLSIAQEQGLEKVWGLVLPENRNMLALGRKLGFTVRPDPDSGDYMLSISFTSPSPATS